MSERIQISHYYTTGTTIPTAENLALGEFAISTNSNNEKIYFKNNDNSIVSFSSDTYIRNNFLQVSGGTVNDELTFNKKITINGNINTDPTEVNTPIVFNQPIHLARWSSDLKFATDVVINSDNNNKLTNQLDSSFNGDNTFNGENTFNGIIYIQGEANFDNSTIFNEDVTFGNGIVVNNSDITINDGSITSSGGFFDTSDEKLKIFGENIKVDLEKLSKLRKAYFKFNDNRDDDITHIGVSAQEIAELYPEIVRKNESGYLTVDYSKLSVIALEGINVLHNKNKELEKRINKIEEILGC